MRRLSPLRPILVGLCLGLCGLCAAPPAVARSAKIRTFSSWTGTCNNLGDCVAIASSDADLFYLRIAREAGPDGAPKVRIVLDPSAAQPADRAATFRLAAVENGRATPIGNLPTTARAGDRSFAVDLTPGAASAAFVEIVRNADRLDYALAKAKGSLGLKGLAATLRWIDAEQGRAGTTTAFVAKGAKGPAATVPTRPAPTIVRAARPGSVAEIAQPAIVKALLDRTAAIDGCDADLVKEHEGYGAWRLGLDTILVEVPCQRAAYNSASAFYLTNAHGEAPRPAPLPRPRSGRADVPDHLLTNAGFDPAAMILGEFNKGRGLADCGSTRTWLWTGESFALLESAELLACPGAFPEDWPNTFTAVRAGPPTPEK